MKPKLTPKIMGLCLIWGLLCLLVINISVWQKEQLWQHGEPILLELAPVDPRSLMQGDYMQLDYELARQLANELRAKGQFQDNMQGWLRVSLDEQQRAAFVALESDPEAPLLQRQRRLPFKVRQGEVQLASQAFFFEEGQAEHFSQGRYGELRLGADGELMLVGLRDSQLKPL
ncbi:GDYXXLXY domain-containing protein [Shewanella algae]|uniref:GDYXXLXY domain-containing protein n=1 Tax=Shewanella algae TaxID=38313 RepID=UPI0031F5C1C0